MIICTLSNNRYLLQGLALFHSIKKYYYNNLKFYYLCLDDYTYSTILDLNSKYNLDIIPILNYEIEAKFPQIAELRLSNYLEYCYSFSSLLPKYIFEKYNEPSVIYIDSDTLFYEDPNMLYIEIGNKDVGIIRHRFNDRTHVSGEYNANVIYIKNNENGNKILDWWHVSFMTKNPARLSTCGDQKFLEGFEDIIGKENVCVIDNIGHGAPWNYNLYQYDKFDELPKKIIWEGREQIFLFNHFSQFVYDFDYNAFSYSGGSHLIYTFDNMIYRHVPKLNQIYLDYYKILHDLNDIYKLNIRNKQ